MIVKIRNKTLAIMIAMAMVFTMMPMMAQPTYAFVSTVELDGGSYTLTADNSLVKDGNPEDVQSIHSVQDVVFNGNTVINLNGYELRCASLKSGFNNPGANEHPWYTYDLTIDGGDKGGSIDIGDSTDEDHILTANNLTIRNLDKASRVICSEEAGSKYSIFVQRDLLIEGIKAEFRVTGANGIGAYKGKLTISDVSGELIVAARSNGIKTDSANNNDIVIRRSNVSVGTKYWMTDCITPGNKRGLTITESDVFLLQGSETVPAPNTSGGYNTLSLFGDLEIKDSLLVAINNQTARPAVIVHSPGKLIVSGESLVACQSAESGMEGGVSTLMVNDIELKDGNRLFEPKDGYIGTAVYNNKTLKAPLNKDGSGAYYVGIGNGKELVNTITSPSKVFTEQPVHMSGVLKDEDGEPVPNAEITINCESAGRSASTKTDARGVWKYEGANFKFSEVTEAVLTVSTYLEDGWVPHTKYLPCGSSNVKVQVIDAGPREYMNGLELPEGENRKTEYNCGEKFDLDSAYVNAVIVKEYAKGGISLEPRDLDPDNTIITPAVLKYGIDKVNIMYMFEGKIAEIDYPVKVSHDWEEATCTEPKTCKGCGLTEGEPLGHEFGAWTKLDDNQHQRICTRNPAHTEKENHKWDAGEVTKAATEQAEGIKTYTCTVCKGTKTEAIPKLWQGPVIPEPTPDPEKQYGTDGTPVGSGASFEAAEKAITNISSDKDIKGSKFAPLKLKSTSQGKGNIKLSWTKNKKAVKYVVYGNSCNAKGKKYKPVKISTTKGGSYNVKKIGKAKVKKGTYYKFIVVALDKKNNVVSTTKTIHVATKGSKAGNHKSVTVKAKVNAKGKATKKYTSLSKTVLKKGKSLKLKVSLNPQSKKQNVSKHVGVRYESSNTKIATVSSKGVIKAKKAKGSCTIYVYAQNGVSKTIKVKVN